MATGQVDVPENPSKNFNEYFRFQLGKDPPREARNTLLVVTTLIAAVTFQAGVNPPGGVWQEDKYSPGSCTQVSDGCKLVRQAGKATLGSYKVAYGLFLFCNTLAFSSATNTILWLLLDSPFQTEILLAVYATNATYFASISAVNPEDSVDWRYMFIAFMLPYFVRVFSCIIKRYK